MANAHDFISTFLDKYQTLVGERGERGSQGSETKNSYCKSTHGKLKKPSFWMKLVVLLMLKVNI